MLETLDHTIRIGSTPTFLYFDLYLYSAYAAHYVYMDYISVQIVILPPPPLGNRKNYRYIKVCMTKCDILVTANNNISNRQLSIKTVVVLFF